MAKDEISITVDADVLAALDADAAAHGISRSEANEHALRNEQLRRNLERYRTHTIPALGINEYARALDQANCQLG